MCDTLRTKGSKTEATTSSHCIEFNYAFILVAFHKVIIISPPSPHVSDVYFAEKVFINVELLRGRTDSSFNFLTSRKVIFKDDNEAGSFFM